MSKAAPAAITAQSDDVSPLDVSASQRMMSAVIGSLLTSLLVTPLDVVRVRLQSQAPSSTSSPLRTSTFKTNFTPTPDLGVTACCREVFWMNNNASYCLAPANSASQSAAATLSSTSTISTTSGPTHTSSPTPASCAVEETRQRTFTTTIDGLRKIARNEGIFTLWRGLSPTLVMAVPANVIYFTGYDALRYGTSSPIKNYIPDNYAPLAAGSVARVAAAVVVSPIEMFRTRMQAAPSHQKSGGLFTATMDGLKDLVRVQGYSSLWRGLTLTMWRDVPFSGFYWWGYESVRNALTDLRESRGQLAISGVVFNENVPGSSTGEEQASWSEDGRGRVSGQSRSEIRSRSRSQSNHTATFVDSFVAGATSGAIASLVTTPFDVGKTRQQIFVHSQDMENPEKAAAERNVKTGKAARELFPEERSMPRFLAHIWRTEGFAGLFRGWAARCMKVAPACAIMISSYEVGKKMAQRVNDRRDR